MSDGMPEWAAWGSLAEEQLAGEAEALLRESRRAPVDRRRVEARSTSTGSATRRSPAT